MSVKPEIETQSSPFDVVLLVASLGLLVGSIFGFYYFETYPGWQRWIGVLVAAALAIVIALQTRMGKSAWAFVRGSQIELRKVIWPTKPETTQTTIAILIVVLILGLMLWGLDSLLLQGTKFLTGQGG